MDCSILYGTRLHPESGGKHGEGYPDVLVPDHHLVVSVAFEVSLETIINSLGRLISHIFPLDKRGSDVRFHIRSLKQTT